MITHEEIEALRLKAFETNAPSDLHAYYTTLSKAFQNGELVVRPSSPGKDGGKRIYEFDRYIKGQLMAEGVTVERASTLEEAFAAAARIASRGPSGEVPVLVMRPMATSIPLPGKDGGQEVDGKRVERWRRASIALGSWMAAALDNDEVCEAMKADIREWFSASEPFEGMADDGPLTISYPVHEIAHNLLLAHTGSEGGSPTVNWYGLRSEIADAIAAALDKQRRLDTQPASTALVEMLTKALEPFAKEADKFDPVENDDHFLTWGTTFTVGDLREARSALSASQSKETGR